MKLENYQQHECCPGEWRGVKDITGSYELDGMIARTKNRDMKAKLDDYVVSDIAYRKRSNTSDYGGLG